MRLFISLLAIKHSHGVLSSLNFQLFVECTSSSSSFSSSVLLSSSCVLTIKASPLSHVSCLISIRAKTRTNSVAFPVEVPTPLSFSCLISIRAKTRTNSVAFPVEVPNPLSSPPLLSFPLRLPFPFSIFSVSR